MSKEFKMFLSMLRDHQGNVIRMRSRVQQRFEAECERAYFKAFPRRKKYDELKFREALPEEHTRLWDRWEPRAKLVMAKQKDHKKWLVEQLQVMARGMKVKAKEGVWTQLTTVYTHTYSTQGFGAITYARESANIKAMEVLPYGLEFHVVEQLGPAMGKWGMRSGNFTVWVNTDELNIEVMDRKPKMSLKDWVKACWKRGVNPRVLNPFLPAGLEDKLGIDYHGNDK